MKAYSSSAVMLALVFAAGLSGCGSTSPTANPTAAAPAASSAIAAVSPTNLVISGASSADNPSDAAKGYFAALFSGAATDQFICTGNSTVTDGLKKMGAAMSAGMASEGVQIDTSGLSYETANQTGDSADVNVSGKVKSTSAAGTSGDHVFPAQTLKMKNENGWKVCGMSKAAS